MSLSDSTPLLGNGRGGRHIHHRSLVEFIKAEGEPSWSDSYRYFLLGSWWNVLLAFIPLSVISHHLQWDAALRFSFSFFAIVPLARLLGEATDQMSARLGQTLAGLLNATFGNAVEIIVGIAALLQDQLLIVQTSMLGSILSNLLLVLGCTFIAGGFVQNQSDFDQTAAQTSSSLMTLSCITLVIPAAYYSSKKGSHTSSSPLHGLSDSSGPSVESGLLTISRGTAVLLLAVYIAYLCFQLVTHKNLYCDNESEGSDEAEGTEVAQMSIVSAGSALLIVTVVTAFCADYLVASIEETAEKYGVPKPFIGIILLPIVANAAEHVTSIWMALKKKMGAAIEICVGSSIQIASFVIPLMVVIGWMTGHEFTLFFANFETIILFVSVLLVNLLIQDGRSNYLEGIMLLTLYAVIALAFWVA